MLQRTYGPMLQRTYGPMLQRTYGPMLQRSAALAWRGQDINISTCAAPCVPGQAAGEVV
jgi:hypothetical protein